MGSYVDSVLTTNEHVIYETKLHWQIYITPLLFSFAIIGIPLLIKAILDRHYSELAVTNKRVIIKTGIITRTAFDTSLKKIEGVIISQSLMGRLLNYGTVIFRGTGGSSQPFDNVSDPFTFKRMADEAIDALDR